MTNAPDSRDGEWARVLERWVESLATASETFTIDVVGEIDSTQDELRRRGAAPWRGVTALRQRAGRGRQGRRWLDEGGESVALSVAVPEAPVAVQMMRGALAALGAARKAGIEDAGLKWPNDLLAGDRKLAGVLVEVAPPVAIIGIGINVSQRSFESPLREIATSLALLGSTADRLEVTRALLGALDEVMDLDPEALRERYEAADLLRGTRRTFEVGAGRVTGVVERVDPLGGIRIRVEDGDVRVLDPALARLATSHV